MPAAKKKVDDEIPELPRQPQVGDRVRLKENCFVQYIESCKRAGWDFDPYVIRTIVREDKFNPGGGRRLFVEGPPYCFASTDVKLAWSSEDDRRRELRKRGWRV